MKNVGVHTHIVSMVGCCTDGKITDIMLLVEYCALGDLLGYLRRSWSAIQQSCCSTPNTPLSHFNSGIFFANNMKIPTLKVNQMYEIEDQLHDSTEEILTSIDLLSFARQIAMGMVSKTFFLILYLLPLYCIGVIFTNEIGALTLG